MKFSAGIEEAFQHPCHKVHIILYGFTRDIRSTLSLNQSQERRYAAPFKIIAGLLEPPVYTL